MVETQSIKGSRSSALITPPRRSVTDTTPPIDPSSAHQSVIIQNHTGRPTLAQLAVDGIACSLLRVQTQKGFDVPPLKLGGIAHGGTGSPRHE